LIRARQKLLWTGFALTLLLAAGWLLLAGSKEDAPPAVRGVEVVRSYPHDALAFTQGLFFEDGALFEGTGEEGTSGLRKLKLETGEVIAQRDLPPPYFGEGIVGWKDRIYQLSWKNQKGFIYAREDLTPRGEFAYSGEGWGITHDGKSLVMSDGSPVLRFLDPEGLNQQRTLTVTAAGCPVEELNELEWIEGEIWANIWRTDLIARIDPATGKVKGFVDVAALGPPAPGIDEVPNGIAYDRAGNRIFVTGKMWPKLYEVRQSDAPPTGTALDQAAALMRCEQGE
jgi:glutaminyl-peptide cyclotransferase